MQKWESINYRPIGFVKSCYPDKFGTPRQSQLVRASTGEIHLHPWVQAEQALEGLSGFSHIWILFSFHKNLTKNYHAKVHPPRLNGESIGVFATRSPHRPNSIGLSLVKLDKIENSILHISHLDIINLSPVLDIKPYLPHVESLPKAKCGWLDEVKAPHQIDFDWPDESNEQLREWSTSIQKPLIILKELIEETLRLDPRPLVYRGYESEINSPHRNVHAVRLFNGDIHFQFISSEKIKIIKIIF